MEAPLPVYKHPALTVLVDDNSCFLESIAFRISPQVAHRTFLDPRAALDWLWNEYRHAAPPPDNTIHVGYDEETTSFERRNASIDLAPVFNTVTNRKRFNIPAVLVADYAMPGMNGLELCEAARGLPCKKILMTGQADERIAIEAFNRGLIDCFIRKSDPDAVGRLETEIASLQRDFFAAQTRTLGDLLSRHSFSFLTDPAIAGIVEELSRRFRFVEHYLFPNPEGILFFDKEGKATLMVIATRSSLATQYELALDQGAPTELLATLREMRLVPFFSDTHGRYLEEIGDDWLQYCLPPQICEGRETYYWALFALPAHYLQEPVYSYAEFLSERAA